MFLNLLEMCTLGWPFNVLYENVIIPVLSIYWQWFVWCFDFSLFVLIVREEKLTKASHFS